MVGVILVMTTVMFIVHAFAVLTSLAFGLLLVDPVGTSGFSETINFSASEASEYLLRELVFNRLAYYHFFSRVIC